MTSGMSREKTQTACPQTASVTDVCNTGPGDSVGWCGIRKKERQSGRGGGHAHWDTMRRPSAFHRENQTTCWLAKFNTNFLGTISLACSSTEDVSLLRQGRDMEGAGGEGRSPKKPYRTGSADALGE